MSRREVIVLILVLLAVTIAGFLFGRVVLPRLVLRIMDLELESSGAEWGITADHNPVALAREAADVNPSTNPDTRPTGDFADIFIEVDVTEQLVRIMNGEKAIKQMVASTGREGHETPLGTFEIQNRGTWFYSEKYKQGAKYWVSFKGWGVYLFHSVAMDKDRQVIQEEAEKLGQPVSHGCVRLSTEDAKWIHDNIPEKTRVVIRK